LSDKNPMCRQTLTSKATRIKNPLYLAVTLSFCLPDKIYHLTPKYPEINAAKSAPTQRCGARSKADISLPSICKQLVAVALPRSP